MVAAANKITVEEMEKNPELWERYELYRGEIVEMTYVKPRHGKVLGKLFFLINDWIYRKNGYGITYGGEAGIKFGNETRYCFDLGWSDKELNENEIPTTSLPLMVEIISDSNETTRMIDKVLDYLGNGAKEVWLIFPYQSLLQVYKPDGTSKFYREEETYVPGEWMKGFELYIKELFI